MFITANGEDVEIVEEERDGDRHLVAKGVPIVKPMELDTGYVPEASIAQSTDIENTHGTSGWSGTTPTLNHPRNDPAYSWHDPSRPNDEIVLAANEEVREALGVGTVENDYWDGEFVRADIAVNADKATEMGGEAAEIVVALENEGPLEVSSQYLHAELPAGNYDDYYREDPKAIAAPDSVALIPNGRGVCSIEDGCGIAPGVTANIDQFPAAAGADDPRNWGEGQRTRGTANVMQDQTTAAGVRQLLSGMASLLGATAGPTDDSQPHAADVSEDDPRGATGGDEPSSDEGAESSADTDSDDAMKTANATFEGESVAEIMGVVGGTIEPQIDELMGEVRENLDDEYDADDVEAIMGSIGGTLTRHVDEAVDDMTQALRFDGDIPDSASNDEHKAYSANMERDELINEITSNSEIKRESLEGMGDTCLETTYANIVGNSNETDDPEEEPTDEPAADDGGEAETDGLNAVMDRLESIEERMDDVVTEDSIDEHVATAANQLEKEERAERIVANSAEYEEDDVEWLKDLPEKELERKEQGASLAGGLPATGTPEFGASGNEGTDTSDMPDLEVN